MWRLRRAGNEPGIKDFEKSTHGTGQAKIAQLNVIQNNLVAKHSAPYH
jgi:hypothetical protein